MPYRQLVKVFFVLVIFATGCSHTQADPPAADLTQLPYLGEDRSRLEADLAQYQIDYHPSDVSPLTSYRFKVGADLIRLSFIYALRKDGKDVLSGINIRHDNIENNQADLSDEATTLADYSRLAVINALLPDRKPVPIADLPTAVQQDASPSGGDEDSAFFASRAGTTRVVQHPHWDIPKQQWISNERCPASSTRVVQVYSSHTDGHTDEAGIYSEWLYNCMKREAFK